MKAFAFLLLLVIISCEQKPKPVPASDKKPAEQQTEITIFEALPATAWFQHYQKNNPDFQPLRFQLKETAPISYQESNVKILNEAGFNEIYQPFLIFNPSKTQYLDFDSYQWFIEPTGNAGFAADQQVALVDYKNKKVRQIAFFGPSYWVEDAYWPSDSVAVLLGNSYDKVPFLMEYNFKANILKNYQYSDTLKTDTKYSVMRLRSKGIKVE